MSLWRIAAMILNLYPIWEWITRMGRQPASSQRAPVNTNAHPRFPPPPPEELLSRPAYYNNLLYQRRCLTPSGDEEDTPTFALYRLYEHLILNRTTGIRNELEGFWFNRWPVESIPDLQGHPEPARYAVFACIPALKADAIMALEEMDEYQKEEQVYESVPEWTRNVKPLEEVLKIPHEGGETLDSFDDQRASLQLKEKNIQCWQPHIHFI